MPETFDRKLEMLAEAVPPGVLNVVPGPRHGDTFTLSASLLRVGVASELLRFQDGVNVTPADIEAFLKTA